MQEQYCLGISSGVLCVIFGIYDKLVESVLGIFSDFKKNFFYLLPIVCGCFIGVLFVGNILSILLKSYPMQTKYLFIGLILGSVPIIINQVNSIKKFRMHYFIYTIVAFIIGSLAVIFENNNGSFLSANIIPSNMLIPLFFIAGFFMSIGIVVPGVSSTVILMCFGIYDIYLQAISTINLYILFPIGTGVLIGGFIFLKIIKYLLDNILLYNWFYIRFCISIICTS